MKNSLIKSTSRREAWGNRNEQRALGRERALESARFEYDQLWDLVQLHKHSTQFFSTTSHGKQSSLHGSIIVTFLNIYMYIYGA